MKVGLIGLTGVGALLAPRLMAADIGVIAWDADTAVEAADSSAVIALCLPSGAHVEELLFGSTGLVDRLPAGTVLVDFSPCTPDLSQATSRRLAERDVARVDAVLLRTAAHEAPADLTLVFAGPTAALDRAQAALGALTPHVVRCGERAGNAQIVRLLDRAMTVASALGALEAVAAGRRMGLSLKSLTDVFVKGSGRNYTTRFVLPALAAGTAALPVSLADLLRDADDIIQLAIDRACPTPIVSVARGLLRIAAHAAETPRAFEDITPAIGRMARANLVDSGTPATTPADPRRDAPNAALTIGYVGLGAMGTPLARRLMGVYPVRAHDARPELARALEAEGATAMTDLAALARACDVIVLCVPSSAVVRELLFAPGGLAEGLSPGKVIVDQTTGDPDEAVAISAELEKLGVALVDAPVSGGPETPALGTSVMICGGPADAFARVRPMLETIGPNVIYCGPVGSGHAAKLVNNAANICNRLIAYEAAMLARRCGIALDVLHQVVNRSTGWSFASERVFKAVPTHAKTASISLELSLKDIASAVRMGIGCGAPMLIGDAARSLFAIGVNQFGAGANVDEIARLYERIGAVDFTTDD